MTSLPPGAILILGAVLLPFLPRRIRSTAFLVFPALVFCLLLFLEPGTSLNVPFLNYELVLSQVDRLSLTFGYVFAIMAFLGGIYGFHLRNTGEQVAALLYGGSSLGVVFAGDLFTLIFFWEIMAGSSVYLIWARGTPLARGAGMRYILMHLLGGSVLLAGIMLHLTETGSILFSHMEGGIAAYLILFGFALNAAVPPLHTWLSDSYPEGTVTGSVFLSAFTTKTAVYALARGFAGWEILMWAGAIMAVYGVVFAVLQNDIRRILAYHIVSQVGYMVCGVGLGTAMALNGATAHAFAHILYKALLFMGAGTVLYATGRSKLTELGGLAKVMPLTLVLYMVGALSISGFPFFSGFVSKSVVVHAAELSHMGTIVLLLNLASVGTFLSVGLKLPYFAWFGSKLSLKPVPIPRGMYVGMALTAGICLIIGVYPALLYNILPFDIDYHPYTARHLLETTQLLIFAGLGFWLLIKKLGGKPHITLDIDWFYRKPSGLVNRLAVVWVSSLFAAVEGVVYRIVHSVIRLSANPIGYVLATARPVEQRLTGDKELGPEPQDYDPDRYRLVVGAVVGLVLLGFVILLAWFLFAS